MKKCAVPLTVLAALIFFPSHSDQWRYCCVLAASLLMMAFFGHVGMLAVSFDKSLIDGTFFLKCCVGQVFLLLLWLAVSPVVFIFKVRLGLPLNLPSVIASIAILATFYKKAGSSFAISMEVRNRIQIIFLFFFVACIFKIAAYYSRQVGAVGLDTHQHIYWVNDLYGAAYLKLAAHGTNLLDQYPKGLHALTALWATPGFGNYIGPALKMMPALQTLLITFAFVEVMHLWLRGHNVADFIYWIWLPLVLLVSFYGTFYGSRLIYPIDDLNSTGRISSAAVVLLPGIIALAASLAPSSRSTRANWFLLPLCSALALKINPSLSIAYLGFSFTLWVSLAFYGLTGNGSSALKGAAIGGLMGLALIVTDPYYLNMLSLKFHNVRNFLSLFGLDALTSAEVPARIDHEFFHKVLHSFMEETWLILKQGVMADVYPDSDFLFNPGGAGAVKGIFLLAFSSWIFVLSFVATRRQKLFTNRLPLITFAIGMFAGCLINVLLGKVVADVMGNATHDSNLLASYAQSYAPLLTLFLAQIVCVVAITVVTDAANIVVTWNYQVDLRSHIVSGIICLSLITFAAALARFMPRYLPTAPKMDGWWPLSGKAITEYRKLESMVPVDGMILADAVPAKLNGTEKWIIPIGRGAAFLPFTRNQYVFNVRLGIGEKFSYDDLYNNFCTGNARLARHFLKENNIKYIFLPNVGSQSKSDFLNRLYCSVSFRDMGVIYPAFLIGKYGIAYYKIQVADG